MNLLSLDFGLARIGYAVGSTKTGIAFPRGNLKNDPTFFKQLERIIHTEKIEKMIVGNPRRSHPDQVSIAEQLDLFLDEFSERYPKIPWEFFDERYTSKIAEQKLYQMGLRAREQKPKVDAMSAQIILQEWMDGRA